MSQSSNSIFWYWSESQSLSVGDDDSFDSWSSSLLINSLLLLSPADTDESVIDLSAEETPPVSSTAPSYFIP